ncbi:8-oxoguanine DNA glycosylase [Candidatus Woesearchaeota archaeon]|nr:MAG: 8-oxoguanine DNA glycosylase [Candidatus Woesearchaeota archaeon]
MKSFEVENFNLEYTLECGQFFRYKKVRDDDLYLVNYRDILFLVRQEGKLLRYSKNVDETFVKRFFRLDDDMEEIYAVISSDDFLKKAIEKYKGLRLIRQDPWECMVSYICSSASNIPKIQMNIENLSQFFGRPIACKEFSSYSFPDVKSISNFENIQQSKTGYRARYIHEVNDIVSEEYFNHLKKLDYDKSKSELVKLPGIGEKIADCICLFSLNHLEAFPIDTWIAKAMKKIYGLKSDKYSDIVDFAINKWGKYAGYAQQYIYMKIRNDETRK